MQAIFSKGVNALKGALVSFFPLALSLLEEEEGSTNRDRNNIPHCFRGAAQLCQRACKSDSRFVVGLCCSIVFATLGGMHGAKVSGLSCVKEGQEFRMNISWSMAFALVKC